MASVLPAPPAAASGAPRPPHQPSSSSLPQPGAAAASSSTAAHSNNAGPHLLSLKVMRVSAPSLAVSEKPYYEYDLGQGGSGDGLLKAVGQGTEDGLAHDLLSNHWQGVSGSTSAAANFPISDLLVLPSSFGTLYLGETFRTYLCVRNDAATAVREPSLRVEMQVGASDAQHGDNVRWHQLAHVILPTPTRYSPDPTAVDEQGRPVWELAPAQPLETALGYDIKDLGPHVLVCTVGYKSPAQQGSQVVWIERSFRKYYKFSVDRSPISVRTKVHQPRHASSLTHPDAAVRKRVELEVQVQNVAGNGASLVFEGLGLRPAPGWRWSSVDRPSLSQGQGEDMWLRKGAREVLADGDVRQYLFTLLPSTAVSLAEEAVKTGIDLGTSAEGYAIRGDALGHLDISWRMSLGEPGRLQTSQLVRRRVDSSPITAPASASKLAPQLTAQVTLQPSALQTLREVRPGSVVALDVDVSVSDVSALMLAEYRAEESGPADGSEHDEAVTADDADDDNTPLSEIASSPRKGRTTASSADSQRITIRRTLRLALQHCSIEPPPPTSPLPTAAAVEASTTAGEAPSTPRKTPQPSRTSTPTQAGVSALNKARLQANLTNLVRNSSLSLRAPRGSVDSARPDSADGASRSATPVPPVPPKPELAAAAEVSETSEAAKVGPKLLPQPVLAWSSLVDTHKVYTETHAQALTRNATAPTPVPATFLPTAHTLPLGSTLLPLQDVHLTLRALRDPTGTLTRCSDQPDRPEQSVPATLQWAVDHQVQAHDALRFGALRVVLLSYTDSVDSVDEDEVECMTPLLELSVLAEALVRAH